MKYLRRFPYWYLLAIPVLLVCLGMASNQAVFLANAGKFPVRMNPTWMDLKCSTKGMDPADVDALPSSWCGKGGQMLDQRHSIMGPNSNLKFLADIFNFGGMYSIGDGFIALGEWLLTFTPFMWLALVIRKLYIGAAAE
jgi:hypothetical protein